MNRAADIAEVIRSRLRIYDSALDADLRRLRTTHGEQPVAEALTLIEREPPRRETWDREAHARQVRVGIERVLRQRREHRLFIL